MTARRRKKPQHSTVKSTNILDTLLDEIAEAVELMRPHFPDDDDDTLRDRALARRAERYQTGHWFFEEAAKTEAAAAETVETDPDPLTPSPLPDCTL